MKECGRLVQAQVLSSKEYRQFRARFRGDRLETFAVSFPSDNIINGERLTHRSRMKAKIDPCVRVRKNRFDDGTYKLTVLPIGAEVDFLDDGDTGIKPAHKVLNLKITGLLSFECPLLYEVIERGKCGTTFVFYDFNKSTYRYIFGSFLFNLAEPRKWVEIEEWPVIRGHEQLGSPRNPYSSDGNPVVDDENLSKRSLRRGSIPAGINSDDFRICGDNDAGWRNNDQYTSGRNRKAGEQKSQCIKGRLNF